MTILQLKYAITVANSYSMREAAGKLFVSQPALSASIRELEQELGIKIFERTNKGIVTTKEGEEFLEYAKQVVGQFSLIREKDISRPGFNEVYHLGLREDQYKISTAFAGGMGET